MNNDKDTLNTAEIPYEVRLRNALRLNCELIIVN